MSRLIGARNQTRFPAVIYPHNNYIAPKAKEIVRADGDREGKDARTIGSSHRID